MPNPPVNPNTSFLYRSLYNRLEKNSFTIKGLLYLGNKEVPELPKSSSLDKVNKLRTLSSKFKNRTLQLEKLTFNQTLPEALFINKDINILEGLFKYLNNYNKLYNSIQQQSNNINLVTEQIKSIDSDMLDILKGLDKCPLCLQDINKGKLIK